MVHHFSGCLHFQKLNRAVGYTGKPAEPCYRGIYFVVRRYEYLHMQTSRGDF